ncbi:MULTISPECIES: TIGR03364 family FAD-dependent oxidoreductase [unclassified Luteococcus]|uniref:TIGR03364 family FAD-dependent oxidoreductase n=1 Tax=unclassified Luteococcus TaxID=2639923 RepID=UPI00313AEA3B
MDITPERRQLVIIGAGIIGLAHAFEAHRRGLRVTVVDREHRATGASVRNFGHACFSAQPTDLTELAASSRDGWLEAARTTGLTAEQCGTLVVARSELEAELLAQLREARGGQRVELLTASRTRYLLGGLGSPEVVGGAHLPLDVRVDPRTTVDRLAAWLAGQGVDFLRATQVGALTSDGSGAVLVTNRGELRAEQVIIATGHDLVHLLPHLAESHQVQRCTLAMHRVATPGQARISPAVLTTTSMLRYGAFTEQPAADQLRRQVRATRPDLLQAVANVMFTQLPDGSLLVGDTHDYADSPLPFVPEQRSRLVLDEAAAVLGVDHLDVLERWQGVYANSNRGPLLVAEPLPGVRVVTVTSGVGMTLSFGLARQSLDAL